VSNSEKRVLARLIKDIELDKTITILLRNAHRTESEDVGPANMLVSHVSNLCADLIDDEAAELENHHMDDLVQAAKVSRGCKKKVYDVSNVRRSSRFKNKKTINNARLKRNDLE
jgi:hypothetical protein